MAWSLWRKEKGRLRGWLSYTWLKSNRVFKDLNGGKAFPSRYDRRHNISITSTYAFIKNGDSQLLGPMPQVLHLPYP